MKTFTAFFSIFLFSSSVFSANVNLVAVPTSWKLQNYMSNSVVIYFTGSPCTSGKLNFGANATTDDKNRFWSTIMAAKISNKHVQVYYEDSAAPDSCEITSFSLMQE